MRANPIDLQRGFGLRALNRRKESRRATPSRALGLLTAFFLVCSLASCSENITKSGNNLGKEPDVGETTAEEDFQPSQDPVSIAGINLTDVFVESYRDAPDPNLSDPNQAVPIYVLLREKTTKKIVPQNVSLGQATVKFDSGDPVKGDRVTDPRVPYQFVFNVPRSKLITESLGKDRILGEIIVSDASNATKVSTSIVIWLSVVAIQGEKTDFGTIVIPPKQKPFSPIKLELIVSANEQAAENVVLRGLGDDLTVTGGTCPSLAGSPGARLTAGCTVELTPTGIRNFSRVVTVSYFNGIRQAHATWPVRGRSAVILGQEDAKISLASSNYQFEVTESSISSPGEVFWDGSRLFVADGSRILIWNGIPSRSNQPADVILGQGDFEAGEYRPGWGYSIPTATSRTNGGLPTIYSDGKKLYAADTQNNRVLIWNQIPQSNGTPADIVLGQDSMNSNNSDALKMPHSIGVFDGKLFVGAAKGDDLDNVGVARQKIFVFDPVPTLSNTAPTKIISPNFDQPYFVTLAGLWIGNYYPPTISSRAPTSDDWTPELTMFSSLTIGPFVPPVAAHKTATDGARMAVADGYNQRILYWKSIPTDAKQPADFVIGQPNFYSSGINAFGHQPDSINYLAGLTFAGNNLAFSDSQNNRVVILPVPSDQNAQLTQIEEEQFESGESAAGFITIDGGRWYDFGKISPGKEGVYSFGVLYHGNTPLTLQAVTEPTEGFTFLGGSYPGIGGTCGIIINGNCTIVVKFAPSEVKNYLASFQLSYHNSIESRQLTVGLTGESVWLADKVMGQSNFFTTSRNYVIGDDGQASDETLGAAFAPTAISSNSSNIVLYDQRGRRNLIWKKFADFNDNNLPDIVLNNNDVRSDLSQFSLDSFYYDNSITPMFAGDDLVLGDCFGNRVLIYRKIPESNNQPPAVILGQSGLGSRLSSSSREGLNCSTGDSYPVFGWFNANTTFSAHGLRPYWDGQKLYVIDSGNNRIKIYNSLPTENNASPDVILTRQKQIRDIIRAGDKLIIIEADSTDWFDMKTSLAIWNRVPTADNTPEDYIFDPYSDWEIHDSNLDSQFKYSYFSSLAWDGQRLFVGDGRKHRVLVFSGVPTKYTQGLMGAQVSKPIAVLGQRNPYEGYANGLGIGAWSIYDPSALRMIGNYLYVADFYNNRVTRFLAPP